jgi:hypothetical protein
VVAMNTPIKDIHTLMRIISHWHVSCCTKGRTTCLGGGSSSSHQIFKPERHVRKFSKRAIFLALLICC